MRTMLKIAPTWKVRHGYILGRQKKLGDNYALVYWSKDKDQDEGSVGVMSYSSIQNDQNHAENVSDSDLDRSETPPKGS
jgi:hypothetical protein